MIDFKISTVIKGLSIFAYKGLNVPIAIEDKKFEEVILPLEGQYGSLAKIPESETIEGVEMIFNKSTGVYVLSENPIKDTYKINQLKYCMTN